VRRRLEETYCERVREAGSHGTWEPDTWLWPGDYGSFRRGVFSREGSLKNLGWRYRVVPGAFGSGNIMTDGIQETQASLGAAAADPLELVLSAQAELSYTVGQADEVLVLTRRGRWWEIEDIAQLLEQVRARIADWPLSWAVICRVYETSGGVVGVSSRSTSGFTVALDASGALSLTATAKARGEIAHRAAHAARRAFTLWSGEPDDNLSMKADPARRRRSMYTPLYNRGYRVAKHLFGRFGRPELLTLDGDPASGRIARSDPVDLLYDSSRATDSLDDIRAMPLSELFEEVTPELLTAEVSAEIDSELHDEEISQVLTPRILTELGVETLESVAVARADVSRLLEIKRRGIATVELMDEPTKIR
jgi:hypothetical protein